MSQRFIKRQENFVCGQCGVAVVGDGYTNHCPHCLYSRHLDIYPGDRAAPCRGLMAPISLERRRSAERIIHRCRQCHYQSSNRVADNDDLAALSSLLLQSGI